MTGLLERHAELEALRRTIAAAHAGQGAVAVVLGEPGVGKTRLLEATEGLAVEAGLRVLRARGAELEASFPFGVVRQLLEPALSTLGELEREAAFAGAAGLARPLFEHPEPEPRPPAGDPTSFATLHGLYWLVANLADHGALAGRRRERPGAAAAQRPGGRPPAARAARHRAGRGLLRGLPRGDRRQPPLPRGAPARGRGPRRRADGRGGGLGRRGRARRGRPPHAGPAQDDRP